MEYFRQKGDGSNDRTPFIPGVRRSRHGDPFRTNKDVLCHSRRPPRDDKGESSSNGKNKEKKG